MFLALAGRFSTTDPPGKHPSACPFLYWIVFFCVFWGVGVLFELRIFTHYQIYDLQIFSPILWVAFSPC